MDDPALRIEWVRAKARAERWQEEVVLLDEEMRRVIDFGLWKAEWWSTQANKCCSLPNPLSDSADALLSPPLSEDLQEGLRAYAAEHEALERAMTANLQQKWAGVRNKAKSMILELDNGAEQANDLEPDDDNSGHSDDSETIVEINLDLDDGGDDNDNDED
jgi:hypothetical protein